MRSPPVVFVFDVVESGRQVYRQLCFSSCLRRSYDCCATKRLGAPLVGAPSEAPGLAMGSIYTIPDLGLASNEEVTTAAAAAAAAAEGEETAAVAAAAAAAAANEGAVQPAAGTDAKGLFAPSLVIARRRGPGGPREVYVPSRHLRVRWLRRRLQP